MDSASPISHRSSPRLLRAKLEEEDPNESHMQSPIRTPPSTRRSPTLALSPNPISLQQLLLLSTSPCRKSRTRPRPLVVDESIESMATSSGRRKSKGRNGAGVSPRNARRAGRRLEKENVREERELVPFDQNDGRGLRRRRRSSRGKASHKERLALVASLPPSSPSTKIEDDDHPRNADGLWEQIFELVMWKNVAKSSLCFGIGTMFFMSSCLSKDVVNFSVVSAASHLGLLILGLSFLYDSFPQRQQQMKKGTNFRLTEEDILRVARLMLPTANAALAKIQEIFSGEPLMTLKVAPVLVFGATYGQLMTPWRLVASGFFLSFTLPKLYACYCDNIHKRVEEIRSRLLEAWESCPRKKFVAATTATILWNLFSLKMRIFAAFIAVVVLRHHHQQQHIGGGGGESAENESKEEQPQPSNHGSSIGVSESTLTV